MQERHNRESVDRIPTHNENQEAHQGGGTAVGAVKHILVNPFNPLAVQSEDNEVCLWPVTPAALTISKLTVTLNATFDEVEGDLKYADAFISLANPVVINSFDTTSGFLADDSITEGEVPAGKCIYLSFDSAPDPAITQMSMDIEFTYD